jgi:hypothetical protein
VQEDHRLAMRANLRLSVAKYARTRGDQMIPRRNDVIDLITDVVDTARWVLVEEPLNWLAFYQWIEKLDLCVGQLDEDDRHTVVRLILWRAHIGAKRVAILIRRRLKVGHRDGHMVKSSDHDLLLLSFARLCGAKDAGAMRRVDSLLAMTA